MLAAFAAEPKIYPQRWVYVRNSLAEDAHLARLEEIARVASEHGLNGMLLAAGMDQIDLKPPPYLERLKKLKEIGERYRLEIIPAIFGPGYGGSILSHDRNLAAGLPVRGALFVAGEGEASFEIDSPPGLANGGFEQREGQRLAAWTDQDAPGEKSFIDSEVFRQGAASLRLEQFAAEPAGRAMVVQEIRVQPYRCYRFRVWIKTDGVAPRTLFKIRAMTPDGKREMARFEPQLPATGDWQEFTGAFNSWYAGRIRLHVGVSGGRAGRLWVDDLRVEEVGLMNVVRRPGAPVRVRNDKSGELYEEGRDYEPIADPRLSFRWTHSSPVIRLTAASSIRTGDRLRVDYFHGTTIYRDQVVVCMSEPKLYEIWAAQIPLIEQHLAPKKYFFNMDEVRIGGHCEACKRRGVGMAEILGDCVTRGYKMVRAANPKADVFVWSDMLYPNHNARNEYYMVDGDFTGAWNHVPKDLIIACWYFQRRDLSLEHFSKLGFRTLAGAYYDADDLDNPKGWLDSLDRAPGAEGIMYTTWQNKYGLLAGFGDLVSKRGR